VDNSLTIQEFLDALNPEDRNKAIGILFGLIPGPMPHGMMKRTTIKISNLGTPEEIRQRIADATGYPLESIPIDTIGDQRTEERENWLAVKNITQPYKDFLQSQTKTTKDKYEELIHLGRFIIDSGFELTIVIPDEPIIYPDFLVSFEEEIIGVEHTRLINPQAKAIIQTVQQFIENAHRSLLEVYPDLYGTVNLFIDYNQPVIGSHNFENRQFSAADKKEVANLIAGYIYSKMTGGSVPKPAFIGDVSFLPNPEPRLDITLGETYIAKDGFEELLLQRIQAKEKRFATYISSSSIKNCWLLIVIDGVSSYSGFDLQTIQFPSIKQSNFATIVLLEAISHRIIWLLPKP
jgi:hypothetical protein